MGQIISNLKNKNRKYPLECKIPKGEVTSFNVGTKRRVTPRTDYS